MVTTPFFLPMSPFRTAALAASLLLPPSALAQEEGSPRPAPPENFRWAAIEALPDEFEGPSLDLEKWMPRHPYWSGREPSRFHPGNVSVKDGKLLLRATSRINHLSEVKDPHREVWVLSSCVTSKKRLATAGSYFECRFRASRLSMTSSFWFQGGNCEIDVVEQIGAPVKNPAQAGLMMMNSHWFERRGGRKIDHATPVKWAMPRKAAECFHTYGVWWRDQHHAWFYHNGTKVAEIRFPRPFRDPMYLFLDTEVFTWAGLPSIASLKDETKNAMVVDWVRAWKLVPDDRKETP